jgi:uncharacterized protein (TIGR02391 family)
LASIDKNHFREILNADEAPLELVAYRVVSYLHEKEKQGFGSSVDKKQMGSRVWLEAVTGKPRIEESGRRLMAAFNWLERHGLLIEEPFGLHQNRDNFRLSDVARQFSTEADLVELNRRLSCRKDLLHERIAAKCWPAFLSGDYSTSIFSAFKEVEVAVRERGEFSDSDYGEALMKKAFLPNGKLADSNEVPGEQNALANLFMGAVGRFRNPAAHRHVEIQSPEETYEMLAFASHLIRIVLDRSAKQSS